MLYANELANRSSWGFPLLGKAAEADVWLCPRLCAAPCPPPSYPTHLCLISSGTTSFQARDIPDPIYHNNCLRLPWLLVFSLPSILQCLARVILLELKSDVSLSSVILRCSQEGLPHTWLDPLLEPTPRCTSWF